MNELHRIVVAPAGVAALAAAQLLLPVTSWAEEAGGSNAQPKVVTCVDAAPGAKLQGPGCFNIGRASGIKFDGTQQIFWHLYMYADEKQAQAARSATGIVVKEYGRVWLSEFGPRELERHGGKLMALAGPMNIDHHTTYSAVLSYTIMRPGDRTPVQTHPGAEGWYVLAGQHCLETPSGVGHARAGDAMVLQQNVPMRLVATGKTDRYAFAVVLHAANEARSTPSAWQPTNACDKQ
jgi:quercetin dioxygenase-like cupin family protein